MPLVDLDSIPQVPLAFMNDDHREEASLLNALVEALQAHRSRQAPAQRVLLCLDALQEHTRAHFAREEAAMREAGFPAYTVHKAEHDRVLAEMAAEVQSFRDGGDPERLWSYLSEAVLTWFADHIQTMDLVIARFVSGRNA